MASIIRFAEPRDVSAIQAIYAPYCESTTISFEVVAPTAEQIAGAGREDFCPVSVAGVRTGRRGGRLRLRQPASRTGRLSLVRGCGDLFGRSGFIAAASGGPSTRVCLPCCDAQGYFKAYAGVTLPNPGSVGIHEAMGFVPVAVYPAEGFKFGKWHDVGWWQLELRPIADEPPEPKPITAIRDSQAIVEAIAIGERLLIQ